jgi:alanyl-tRNA synthetase
MSPEEILQVERLVNEKIRENIVLNEKRNVPFDEAKSMGAMALFGEKYGEYVRVISFDPEYSVELCGGTHVPATGQIGFFKIISESAIAAGVRRIEAVTGEKSEEYVHEKEKLIEDIHENLKNAKDLVKAVKNLVDENRELQKKVEQLLQDKVDSLKGELLESVEMINGVHFVAAQPEIDSKSAKNLAFSLRSEMDHIFLLIITSEGPKVNLTLAISDDLIREKGMHAGNMIRELAKYVKGGGGGQPSLATAGGSDSNGIVDAIEHAKRFLLSSN